MHYIGSIGPFELPVKVEVNPFGKSEDGRDNIFINDKTGICMLIVGKHPVWNHLEQARLEMAHNVARLINCELEREVE